MKKATIFLPLIGNGTGDIKLSFMTSVIELLDDYAVQLCHVSYGCYVPWARNRAVTHFLDTDIEYLLFIDMDIAFKKEHVDKLFESEEPIIAGLYFIKNPQELLPCFIALPGQGGKFPVGGIEPVARVGTGFLRIHRSVFEKLKPTTETYQDKGRTEYDFFPTGPLNNEYRTEDWAFCDNARKAGFKVMLDTTVQVLHEGTAFYPITNHR